ncbi:MAG: hypothetical protein LUE87_06395, partial [Lachnospiraceae bacterium]|nr:hypothetical protein [Lachnospiraceae bacterium]
EPEETQPFIKVVKNPDYSEKNPDYSEKNTGFSTEKPPKVKENKVNKSINTMCKADALALFEELWILYPSKKGKARVSEKAKLQLLKIGRDEMVRAIDRYKTELSKDSWRHPQNGSTFFNSGYVDYLDANYVPGQQPRARNDFLNHEQSSTDYAALEKMLE